MINNSIGCLIILDSFNLGYVHVFYIIGDMLNEDKQLLCDTWCTDGGVGVLLILIFNFMKRPSAVH